MTAQVGREPSPIRLGHLRLNRMSFQYDYFFKSSRYGFPAL